MDRKNRNTFIAFLKRQSNKELIKMYDNALQACISFEVFDLICSECGARNIDPFEYSEDAKNANS